MTTNKIIFKNALIIYLSIVGFYFFTKLVGLSHMIELRFLNIVFVILGMNMAIKSNLRYKEENNYLSNLYIGFTTGVMASFAVILSMIFYVKFIDSSLLDMIRQISFWGNHLDLSKVVFSMIIESSAACAVSTLTLMQYWKKQEVNSYS
ncbi:hypothetical protein ACXGQW_11350 [Wenyingzhuangia sp. IMCC45533]